MKKVFIRVFACLMIMMLAVSFTACGSKDAGENKAEHIVFSRGIVEGHTYTSKFTGLTLTIPETWSFASDEEIEELMQYTSDFLEDPSKFDKAAEGELMDCYATSADGMENMSISYTKGNILTDLDASIKLSVDTIIDIYESSGFIVEATEPEEVQVGGKTFKRVTFTEDLGGVKLIQYGYFAMFNNYLVNISCTCLEMFKQPASYFENMFS
ncbi:MAG: hypothetical protein MJ092_05595 [Lachnospiraceae bacterium]|nr:hypothetical protein [Lachnospiraceae bacterium]